MKKSYEFAEKIQNENEDDSKEIIIIEENDNVIISVDEFEVSVNKDVYEKLIKMLHKTPELSNKLI